MRAEVESRARLNALARSVRAAAWFAALGQDLTAGEKDDVAFYLIGLGMTGLGFALVSDWHEASRVADHPDWDRDWLKHEDDLRLGLLARAAAVIGGKAAAMAAISPITDEAAKVLPGMAAEAGARFGMVEPGPIKAAIGAAAHAVYLAALAQAAGADDQHPFVRKLALFRAGHWPLVVLGGRFYLF
jgi:hypothetical protein